MKKTKRELVKLLQDVNFQISRLEKELEHRCPIEAQTLESALKHKIYRVRWELTKAQSWLKEQVEDNYEKMDTANSK